VLVYIREAHAIDSPLPMEFGLIEDPVTDAERQAMASRTCEELDLPLPAVFDGVDDAVNLAYHAWPERLYVIAEDGNVSFVGGPGPFEFDVDAWQRAIERAVGGR
jgi:hypothetical protein